jgi:hypothetical protein
VLPLLVVAAVIAAATATSLGGGAHVVAAQLAVALPTHELDLARIGASGGALIATLVVLGSRVAADLRHLQVEASRERARGDLVGIAACAAVGSVGHAMLEPLARDMGATAIGAGLGLLVTSVALGSIGIARAPVARIASPAVAALGGAGLALGALPGGAPIALGVAALVWSGLAELDALEVAAIAALPLHAMALVRALDEGALSAAAFDPGATAFAVVAGIVGAALALVGLRKLAAAGSTAATALYTGTLGFALLGYAYVSAP